jgi:hypothetical protein
VGIDEDFQPDAGGKEEGLVAKPVNAHLTWRCRLGVIPAAAATSSQQQTKEKSGDASHESAGG